MSGNKVEIGGQYCGNVGSNVPADKWWEVKCTQPIRGTSVQITTVANKAITVAGVIVLGTPTNRGPEVKLNNASQSNDFSAALPASNAIDGDANTFSSTKVEGGPGVLDWWKANFVGGAQKIG